jgi:hypothetical protein
MHASDAAALFVTPGDEDEDIEDDIYEEGGQGGYELDVHGSDSRGGSPVDEGDQVAIPVRFLLLFKEEFY